MWKIVQTVEFQQWFDGGDIGLQEHVIKYLHIVHEMGPALGRPYVDTIKGSRYKNLKELRFNYIEKVIRIFFVFDCKRNAVILIGGNKAGITGRLFYKSMIRRAEQIYRSYLLEMK